VLSAGLSNNFDLEAFINNASADFSKSDSEGKKILSARIRTHTEKIEDKRQERIDNLKEQMRAASAGACIQILRSIVKVFDIVLKPLSALTGGQLDLELGKALEVLQKAKAANKLFGLQIDGKQIQHILQNFKKLLQEDNSKLEEQNALTQKQNQRILEIIDEIHDGFNSSVQP
jgi:hypothetical protein